MIPKFRGQEKDIEYYHSLAALAVCYGCGWVGADQNDDKVSK